MEGALVHNPTWYQVDFPLFISESSPREEYAGPEQSEWTNNEIAEVREVLQKLTAIRILNPTDAEDLVQDTLLTMITKYPGCELEKGLLVWSMGILRKKVGNYYRKMQRFAPFSEYESCAQHPVRDSKTEDSPEARLSHQELQDLINGVLAQLPSTQRRPMELLIAGLDSGEIVRQLQPERYQNVINRIYRGRKKLAKELAKHGYGPGAKCGMRKLKRCSHRK
jgi:RNA polymerase sigma factor (sigma-70 family)